MSTQVYDLETDNLLPDVTRVHCLVTRDIVSGQVRCFYRAEELAGTDVDRYPEAACCGTIEEGIAFILAADLRIGHNIQGYDELVLQKLYPDHVPPKLQFDRIRDTLIGARVGWPDEHLKNVDYIAKASKNNTLPPKLIGRHSLEAWGHRLRCHKGDFGEHNGWAKFTLPMLLYCIQDTKVTAILAKRIAQATPAFKGRPFVPKTAWVLEQRFAYRIDRQQKHGFPFSRERAEKLAAELMVERAKCTDAILAACPPFKDEYTTTVKKLKRVKTTAFNPGSRAHLARFLIEVRGWKPRVFTPEGRPQVDEAALEGLPYPEVPLFERYLMLDKRMSSLAEGKGSWLHYLQPDGRIHGKVSHNAAVTGRCTHNSPNVTGVPKAGKKKDGSEVAPYGTACRACFTSIPGYKLVGGDASGLELRMLAHYMAEYDNGAYIKVVTTGDVHSVNMTAAGLTSRDQAKTFIYAFLYGAGGEKLGKIVGGGKAAGDKLKRTFLTRLPALRKLIEDTQLQAKIHRMLETLDGRKLHVRSAHAALNTKLQGAGAIVMKLACVLYQEKLESEGLIEGDDFFQVHQAHDEVQVLAKDAYAERVGQAIVGAIAEAGRQLGVRCPLTGGYKVGNDWAETH